MTTALASVLPELPGESTLDPSLVSRAAEYIRRVHGVRACETARDIGEYILSEFFGGDVVAYRERSKSHVSFVALCNRRYLPFSPSYLWYAVEFVEQLRSLPPEIIDGLSFNHHRALAHVKDGREKARLAREAVAESLSSRALERRIHGEPSRPVRPRGGRRQLPLEKAISGVRGMRELARSEAFDVDALLAAMTVEEALDLLEDAEAELDRMQEVYDSARQHLEERRDAPRLAARRPRAIPAPE